MISPGIYNWNKALVSLSQSHVMSVQKQGVTFPPMYIGKQTELICKEKKTSMQRKIHRDIETLGITDFFLIPGFSPSLEFIMISVLWFSDTNLYSYNKFNLFYIFCFCLCYLPSKESQLYAVDFQYLVIHLLKCWMWQWFETENWKQYVHYKASSHI